MKKSGFIALLAALSIGSAAAAADSFAVSIEVDAAHAGAELTPIWRFFGADEPNYATMKDGRQLLGELGALKQGEVYFRAHNLLSSGDGTPALKWGSTQRVHRGRRRQSRVRLAHRRRNLRRLSIATACGRTCSSDSCRRR